MNYVRSNNLSLKYQRFTQSGFTYIEGLENLSLRQRLNVFVLKYNILFKSI